MTPDDNSPASAARTAEADDPFRRVRLDKLETLRGMGIDPYPVGFSREHQAAELDRRYADIPAGTETGDRVSVAGRIRAMRNSGMFIDLHDASGKIQIFSHKDYLRAEDLPLLKLLDIGDLIGVEGFVSAHAARRTDRQRRAYDDAGQGAAARCRKNITGWPISSCATGSAIST